jgi:Leucine-rich repeat (LRR) protein
MILVFQFILILLCCFQLTTQSIIDYKKKYLQSYTPIYSNSYNPFSLEIPSSELQILKDIFIQTNGNYWIWQNESLSGLKWNFDDNSNPCGYHNISSWQGISCTCSNQTEYHPYIDEQVFIDDVADAYYIYYDDNKYPIPSTQKCNINKIFLIEFNMTGVLPFSMGNLINLTHLHIVSNKIEGEIPTTLGLLTNMEIFTISVNRNLSGPIPSELGNLNKVRFFNLENNKLTSTLPPSLSQFSELIVFFVDSNMITGTLPNSYSNMLQLQIFDVSNNKLTGTVPSLYSNLQNLSALDLRINQFSQSIPSSLAALTNLIYFALDNNKLTNSIPNELYNLVNLNYLYFHDNLLSGTINDCISNLNQLQYLQLQNNKLTGSLSSNICLITTLIYIDVSYNNLTGSIPSSFSLLSNLRVLFVTKNSLSGNLDYVFNNTNQLYLTSIDVSHNRFSGSIPHAVFSIQTLNSFASVENCFKKSTLPIDICLLPNLQSLCLDGLYSSSSCRNNIFTSISTSIWPKTYFTTDNSIGNVPNCLFNMSSLQTLHLSGNGIKVKLSNISAISPSLQDLSLSNNAYSGSIPSIIQDRKWIKLDLRYNKFDGIISPNIPSVSSGSSLKLANNHLSGNIPNSIIDAENIEILTNNIFYCKPSLTVSSLLPSNDPDSRIYICGSNRFYVSMSILIIIVLIFIYYKVLNKKESSEIDDDLICCNFLEKINSFKNLINEDFQHLEQAGEEVLLNKIKDTDNNRFIFSNISGSVRVSNITELCYVAYGIWRSLLYFGCLLTFVCLPVSLILSQKYKSYLHSYGGELASILLSGVVPVVVMILMINAIMIFIYFLLKWNLPESSEKYKMKPFFGLKEKILEENILSEKSCCNSSIIFFAMSIIVFINIIVMFSINGAYVYSTLVLNGNLLFFIEIIIASNKVLWKDGGLLFFIRHIKKWVLNNDYIPNEVNESIIFQCSIGIFNNIFIPFFATAFVNPNCFYNILVQQNPITSSYNYQVCNVINSVTYECEDVASSTRETSYTPPFDYSGQWYSLYKNTILFYYL